MATATILSSGRRRWTSEEKRRLVEESLAAGASASDVARRHGVDVNRIYAWRRRLRDRMPAKDDRDNARIIPVTVASFSGALSGSARDMAATAAVEVMLRNGRLLRVPEGVCPLRAGALADALEGIAG